MKSWDTFCWRSSIRKSSGKARFGIVASRFNSGITDRLVLGASDFLRKKKARIEVVKVPGAFELPHRAMKMASSGRYRAVVAIGCILAGDTPHHRYLSQATISGLTLAGVLSGVPVTCGLITAQSWSKAMERSQAKGLNRGREAAEAAWEMANE